MNSLLIRNAMLVNPGAEPVKASLLVENGRIAGISADAVSLMRREDPACKVIEAEGMLLFPGLIDPHVHFRDPGFTDKEDILTGAAAAAHGGYTSVIMMGNTDPPLDTPAVIRSVLEKGSRTGIRVYCCGNVTRKMRGAELTDFEELVQAGAVLLSDDGLPLRDPEVMEQACRGAAKAGLVLSLHEEAPEFITQAGINRGTVSEEMGLGGADRMAEISMVERDILLATKTGAEITVQHISARESVELIRKARSSGIRVHAEATPHHFSLTEEAVRKYGTNARMNPPLREESDRRAIIAGLADGTIDMIATDHAPHTAKEKQRDIEKAPSGIIGLETALSLAYRELVMPGYLTWTQVIERMTAAYRVYRLPGGTLTIGAAADLTLFAPEEKWQADDAGLFSKARNTPFLGETLPGVVKLTICGGRIVYEE